MEPTISMSLDHSSISIIIFVLSLNFVTTNCKLSSSSLASAEKDRECLGNRNEALELARQCSKRCRPDVPCENVRKQCLCDGVCGLSCLKPDLNCPDLPKVENGSFSPNDNVFNTKVVYKCEPNYYMYGSRERICQGDEDWSGLHPICLPEPKCLNPLQVNHAQNPNQGTYRLNERVEYSCFPGYDPKGYPEATCKMIDRNHTGWVWTSNQFKCIPRNCGDPGQIENGKRFGESFIIASSVLYTCNEGFEMVGQARMSCQLNGSWTGQAPRCESKDYLLSTTENPSFPSCKSPPPNPKNGRVTIVSMRHGSKGYIRCLDGFKLVGDNETICNKGEWSSLNTTCDEIYCGFPGTIEHGRVLLVGLMGMYEYKPYIRRIPNNRQIAYECDSGYRALEGAPTGATCMNGQWKPEGLASCVKDF